MSRNKILCCADSASKSNILLSMPYLLIDSIKARFYYPNFLLSVFLTFNMHRGFNMEKLFYSEYTLGRRFLGRLAYDKDLISSIENFCRDTSISMATFSVIGAVSSVTIGSYDQKQQVYVTFKEKAPLEIVSCTGNISLKDGYPMAHAHIVLGDEQGKTIGGHLFSETIVFAGEIDIQELTGKPMKRAYDVTTGLMLWKPSS